MSVVDMPAHPIEERWKTIGETESLTRTLPPRRYLLTRPDEDTNGMANDVGVLQLGKTGQLHSPGGAGKSYALVGLALAVSTGRRWLDYFYTPNPGPVLLACAEEDREELDRRLQAVARAMRLTDEQAKEAARSVVSLPLAGIPVPLVDVDGNDAEALQALRRQLRGRDDWRLVVLDPLARFAHADAEKDNAAATRFMQAVESLTHVPGNPTVLVSHHTSKLSRVDGVKANAASSRGASALTDGTRWAAQLESLGDDAARLTIVKSNYALCGAPIDLVREGGYLRAATADERKRLQQAKADARDDEREREFEALQERICDVLRAEPGLSKAVIRERVHGRERRVSAAVDVLEHTGRVSKVGRYAFALALDEVRNAAE